jgi:ankyrin repeat protein
MNRCQIAFALIAIFMTLGGCASMSDDSWVETDDLSSVKQYLAADKGRLHQRDAKGKTILHLAAEKGRTDIVIYLLQEGASPDAQDHNGDSPLQFAAYEGYLDITTLLIESGANINSVNRYGVTPLLNSLFNKKYEIARVLVLKGQMSISKAATAIRHYMWQPKTAIWNLSNFWSATVPTFVHRASSTPSLSTLQLNTEI